mgnify:CR=1 FL=1
MLNILRLEFLLVIRSGSHVVLAFSFFLFFILLFALSAFGDNFVLSNIGLTAVWLSLLMSILLTLNKVIHVFKNNCSLGFSCYSAHNYNSSCLDYISNKLWSYFKNFYSATVWISFTQLYRNNDILPNNIKPQ